MSRKLAMYAFIGLSPLCLALVQPDPAKARHRPTAASAPKPASRGALAIYPPLLGRLALKQDLMLMSADDWRAFLTTVPFNQDRGTDSSLANVGPNGCTGSQQVLVFPAMWSFLLSHTAAKSDLDDVQFGFLLAMLVNPDPKCSIPNLALPAGGTAYWVARREGTGPYTYASYLYDADKKQLAGPLSFVACDHGGKSHKRDEARVKRKADECQDHTPSISVRRARVGGPLDAAAGGMACSGTCC